MRLLFPLLLTASSALAQQMPVVQLNAGMHLIRAEVAADYATRMTGLMHRASMPSNAGMLFIFDERGAIINVEDMAPQTEDSHCASRPARYALEMNRGWFAARGLKPGSRISGIPGIK